MNEKRVAVVAGVGCVFLIVFLMCAVPLMFLTVTRVSRTAAPDQDAAVATQKAEADDPKSTLPSRAAEPQALPRRPASEQMPGVTSEALTALYQFANPGVVNVEVQVSRGALDGQGAGSGFILDGAGHILTNNHVVADANRVLVIFYNGIEAEAEVIGTDDDSDLAVIKVDELAAGAHPLPLGDSDQVQPGEWVVAIGNPFQFGGSMMVGIVSAVGRAIPSGLTPFSIPQAIQTDAAINPGNSGGPLLNLNGEVIGVNAQIARPNSDVRANSGVGFAIPSNVVNLVVPSLIENGSYEWPWLGVSGTDVNLAIMKANDLGTQEGAYISEVIPDGPAARAGLQGSSRTADVGGIQVPVGGDVIIEVDGKPITDFNDLLVEVAFKQPGDTMEVTILRAGRPQKVTVTLEPRPASFGQ
jgi:2-alkenal reductase